VKVSEKHSISIKAIFDRKGNAAFATKVVTATPTHFDSNICCTHFSVALRDKLPKPGISVGSIAHF